MASAEPSTGPRRPASAGGDSNHLRRLEAAVRDPSPGNALYAVTAAHVRLLVRAADSDHARRIARAHGVAAEAVERVRSCGRAGVLGTLASPAGATTRSLSNPRRS